MAKKADVDKLKKEIEILSEALANLDSQLRLSEDKLVMLKGNVEILTKTNENFLKENRRLYLELDNAGNIISGLSHSLSILGNREASLKKEEIDTKVSGIVYNKFSSSI